MCIRDSRYTWPDNIRELQSVLKQALLSATGPVLTPDFLPPLIRSPKKTTWPAASSASPAETDGDRFIAERLAAGSRNLYAEWLELTDRQLLKQVLQHTGGNLSRASEILGINRRTLRAKVQSLGLDATERP